MNIIDEAFARYRSRIDTRRASREDAQFNAETKWLRNMLALVDMAMEDEGISERSRERVIRTILYGGPDPIDAERRIDERVAATETLISPPRVYP